MPELIEKKKAGRFSWLAVAAGCGSLFYYMGCLLVSGLDTSGLWVWPLFSVLCFGTAMLLSKVPTGGFWYLAGKIAAGLTALLFLAFFLFEIGVVWGMTQTAPDTTVSAAEVPDMVLPSAEAADEKAVDGQTGTATKESLDYVIILGGGVVGEQPSPALEQRILTAYDYLKNHPETKVIATGGLGGGRISEAACIARTLEGLGIAGSGSHWRNRPPPRQRIFSIPDRWWRTERPWASSPAIFIFSVPCCWRKVPDLCRCAASQRPLADGCFHITWCGNL